MFCQQQVVQLHRELSGDLDDLGAAMQIIGNGQPTFVDGFRKKSGYDGPIYADPGRRTYRALGFRRGIRTAALNLDTVKSAVTAYGEGFRQTRTAGDPWQLGGVLVVTADGEIVYEYASEFAGDHPRAGAILDAVKSA